MQAEHAGVRKLQDTSALKTACDKTIALGNASAADPGWKPLYDEISTYYQGFAHSAKGREQHLDNTCKTAEDFKIHMDYYCVPDAAGQRMIPDPVSGKQYKTDAFYCGNPELSWSTRLALPVTDLCTATVGIAYEPGGICTNVKELVQGVCVYMLQWVTDPYTINVPGMDCFLGIGDCDIDYCHNCPGLCPTREGHRHAV